MKSLVPEHCHALRIQSASRISDCEMFAWVISYLRNGSFPSTITPFIQTCIYFFERKHMESLQRARNDLDMLIELMKKANALPEGEAEL